MEMRQEELAEVIIGLKEDMHYIRKALEGNGQKGYFKRQEEIEIEIENLKLENSRKLGTAQAVKYIVGMFLGNGILFAVIGIILKVIK
jgi:hypothetical protein